MKDTTQKSTEPVANILIVDDTPINLQLLSAMLTQRGFRPRPVTSGKAALIAADAEKPDLILMDVSMPEMNGYETCEKLKAKPNLRDVPVLFLSALSQTEDKIRGFRAGGVDYITKPFLIEEIDARINAHLRAMHYQRDLKAQNEKLEAAVAERTRDLNNAYKALQQVDRMKREFFLMLSHEMRTPSNGILGISEFILNHCPDSPDIQDMKESYFESRTRLMRLLDDIQYLIALEEKGSLGQTQTTELGWFLQTLEGHLHVTASPLATKPEAAVPASEAELQQLVLHLADLADAFNAPDSQCKPKLQLSDRSLELCFELPSLRLNQAQCDAFFLLGSTVRASSRAERLGLAPIVAKRIVDVSGGTITLTSTADGQGLMTITLPIA